MVSPAVTDKENRKRKLVVEEESSEDEIERAEFSDEEGGIRIDEIYIPPPPQNSCTSESYGPRLIITRIVNENFKSYAGQQILGPFHKRFNAIIGPNGSGKSNVIDSMLFVFGYRASKIRSKKISVLLHNSEHYRNVQACTVSVHFGLTTDEEVGNGYDIIPGSEFVVSRTALKDNSSYYHIDGRKVHFKEVAQLLRKHGIDLDHNRFLILQGEVEQIAMMKCKAENEHETGMLEYLEDIIGTSRYKVPLEKLQEKVELLADQRTEKCNRVKLVLNELEELRGPKDKAVEFLKTENTVVICKNFIHQKQIHDLHDNIKDKENEKSGVEESYKELHEALSKIQEEKTNKQNFVTDAARKHENLVKRKDALKEAFNKASRKDEQLLADMTQLNNTRKKTKALLAQEEKKLTELETIPEKNEKTIGECQRKEEELSQKKEKLEADKVELLATVRVETQDLQEQKERLQVTFAQLKKTVDETKTALSQAEAELSLCLSNEENQKVVLENIRTALSTNRNAIQEKAEVVSELKKKIPATETTLRAATEELKKVKYEQAQLISNVQKNRASLEEARSSMQASHSRNRIVDALMNEKKKGRCPGVFGRLGDLGGIDQKYDVAVSTACGRLDNIIVDSADTAQWCIEYLKQNGFGRTVFIALEKIQHLTDQANSRIQTPENVHRLYDLIRTTDDRVKTAFYFSLGNTLVADDLEQATRVAYGVQRFRVVTLKGDIIETSGTMSGGGKTVRRGRMGQSAVATTSPEEIKELESNVSSMETQLERLQQRQNNLEHQLKTLEPELRQMNQTFEIYSAELKSLKEQQPVIMKQLKEQEVKAKTTKSDPVKVKHLQNTVNSKKVEFDKANAAASELQKKIDVIAKEIEEKTTGKIKAITKKIKEVTQNLNGCKSEISNLSVGIKTSLRNVKTSKEKIETMQKNIVKYEEDLKAMKAEREETESDAQQLLTCLEEVTTELEKEQDDYSDLKREVAELAKKEHKLKSDEIELEEKLKTFNSAINDYKAKIHQYKAKISQLKLHNIPEETTEGLKTYSEEDLCNDTELQRIQNELHVAEAQLKEAKPNLKIIEEFSKKQNIFLARSKELEDISAKKTQMADMYEKVKNKRKEEFLIGYNIIRRKLKEMYQMITLGGDANFETVDSFDPFSEGIQFKVRPPKKTWKNISNLSGGEKTLSSLALVFALHYYKPSPLYVMDEIDAALDFKNVSIVGNYIKERTKNAQFIIISLRNNMFELCDNLVGIYKTRNCTKSVTINPGAFESSVSAQITESQTPLQNNGEIIQDEGREEGDSQNENQC